MLKIFWQRIGNTNEYLVYNLLDCFFCNFFVSILKFENKLCVEVEDVVMILAFSVFFGFLWPFCLFVIVIVYICDKIAKYVNGLNQ